MMTENSLNIEKFVLSKETGLPLSIWVRNNNNRLIKCNLYNPIDYQYITEDGVYIINGKEVTVRVRGLSPTDIELSGYLDYIIENKISTDSTVTISDDLLVKHIIYPSYDKLFDKINKHLNLKITKMYNDTAFKFEDEDSSITYKRILLKSGFAPINDFNPEFGMPSSLVLSELPAISQVPLYGGLLTVIPIKDWSDISTYYMVHSVNDSISNIKSISSSKFNKADSMIYNSWPIYKPTDSFNSSDLNDIKMSSTGLGLDLSQCNTELLDMRSMFENVTLNSKFKYLKFSNINPEDYLEFIRNTNNLYALCFDNQEELPPFCCYNCDNKLEYLILNGYTRRGNQTLLSGLYKLKILVPDIYYNDYITDAQWFDLSDKIYKYSDVNFKGFYDIPIEV